MAKDPQNYADNRSHENAINTFITRLVILRNNCCFLCFLNLQKVLYERYQTCRISLNLKGSRTLNSKPSGFHSMPIVLEWRNRLK